MTKHRIVKREKRETKPFNEGFVTISLPESTYTTLFETLKKTKTHRSVSAWLNSMATKEIKKAHGLKEKK